MAAVVSGRWMPMGNGYWTPRRPLGTPSPERPGGSLSEDEFAYPASETHFRQARPAVESGFGERALPNELAAARVRQLQVRPSVARDAELEPVSGRRGMSSGPVATRVRQPQFRPSAAPDVELEPVSGGCSIPSGPGAAHVRQPQVRPSVAPDAELKPMSGGRGMPGEPASARVRQPQVWHSAPPDAELEPVSGGRGMPSGPATIRIRFNHGVAGWPFDMPPQEFADFIKSRHFSILWCDIHSEWPGGSHPLPGRMLTWHGTSLTCARSIVRDGCFRNSEAEPDRKPRPVPPVVYTTNNWRCSIWYSLKKDQRLGFSSIFLVSIPTEPVWKQKQKSYGGSYQYGSDTSDVTILSMALVRFGKVDAARVVRRFDGPVVQGTAALRGLLPWYRPGRGRYGGIRPPLTAQSARQSHGSRSFAAARLLQSRSIQVLRDTPMADWQPPPRQLRHIAGVSDVGGCDEDELAKGTVVHDQNQAARVLARANAVTTMNRLLPDDHADPSLRGHCCPLSGPIAAATDENEGTVGGTTDAKATVKDEPDVRATGKDETDVKDTDDSDTDWSGLLRRVKMLAQTCYSVAQKKCHSVAQRWWC